ncbi:flavin reductase family protein [Kitasatospora sp. NBC_01266]|uniref:flavin reductase family protein n=1 Tax=Kitasatospora sp. NBC_01266 TaxID=2903572 RepID=UPI002E3694CE|nr:flavin reductase family protein [Kitasatospora sp. NBC_01266]
MTATRAQCPETRHDRHGPRQPARPAAVTGAAERRADPEHAAGTGRPPQPDELRRVFGAFPTGVTAIAALVDGTPVGLAASSFTTVSLDPPLVSVCVAHTSTTWPLLRDRARIGVSVLGAHQESACRRLAARDGDRFQGLDWRVTPAGAVLIEGAGAWFECGIEQHLRAGDHDIVLLRVHALDADRAVAPLVFHASRFRRLESAAESRSPGDPRPAGDQEST